MLLGGQQSHAEANQVRELSWTPLLTALTTSWDPHLAVSTRGLHIWPKWVEMGAQTLNITILPGTNVPETPILIPRGTSRGLWPNQRLDSSDSKKGDGEKGEDPLDSVTRKGGCGELPWPVRTGGGEVAAGGSPPSGAALSSSCKYLM